MNNLNYASREASQRLVDAGIVLKTDFYWASVDMENWSLCTIPHKVGFKEYPAPSMAEVWRELPEYVEYKKDDRPLIEYLRIDKNGDGSLSCGYGQYSEMTINDNPTDALIDLLIWVRKEATDGKRMD